jgi:hypothetical protein
MRSRSRITAGVGKRRGAASGEVEQERARYRFPATVGCCCTMTRSAFALVVHGSPSIEMYATFNRCAAARTVLSVAVLPADAGTASVPGQHDHRPMRERCCSGVTVLLRAADSEGTVVA